jgi:multidrug efflux pump subunit AcrA (membrane-fusion protein)
MKKRTILISALFVIVIAVVVWFSFGTKVKSQSDIFTSPRFGKFLVTVTTTGELQAKNSIMITGPVNARTVGIWQMKILNLVPEGTVVKKGEFVAELDKSEIETRRKETELNLQKYESQFTQAKLDSTLTLSQARDELVNLRYTMEEKKILKEQSIYEPPAIRRQAEIDYERSQRNYQQAVKNYKTKTQQAIAKIKAVEVDFMKERQRFEMLLSVIGEFTIKAPAVGMVIYAREWNGKKKVVGSTVSPWEPSVATLPDLKVMESITYINEVDIQKITNGQNVNIKLDADPNKKLTGKITNVANIGEKRPNSDSKVFEVRILISESDTTLRPAMTTSNEIIVATFDSVISAPLECIHTEGLITFIYKKSDGKAIKQQVELGMLNENEVIILRGLNQNDVIFLSIPPDIETIAFNTLPEAPKKQNLDTTSTK